MNKYIDKQRYSRFFQNQEWGKGESGYELWIPSLSNVGYILGISA